MNLKPFTSVCEVCGERRGRGKDHSKCSRILQKRAQEEAEREIKFAGQNGGHLTVQHARNADHNNAKKSYLKGTTKWPE